MSWSEPLFLCRALGEGFLEEVAFRKQVELNISRWGLGCHGSVMEQGGPGERKQLVQRSLLQNWVYFRIRREAAMPGMDCIRENGVQIVVWPFGLERSGQGDGTLS